jgi:hypothetical protein
MLEQVCLSDLVIDVGGFLIEREKGYSLTNLELFASMVGVSTRCLMPLFVNIC